MTSGASPRALGLGLSLAMGLGVGACFIESAVPSTFRYECSESADCEDGQTCASGLCQQPCGGAEDEACPQEAPVCFNGYCSSICPSDEDVCPAPQECVSLGEDAGGSGLCAELCEDNAGCPEGDVCVLGLCATPCVDDSECGESETCVANVCISAESGGSGGFP